jgi:hypothetical protein
MMAEGELRWALPPHAQRGWSSASVYTQGSCPFPFLPVLSVIGFDRGANLLLVWSYI